MALLSLSHLTKLPWQPLYIHVNNKSCDQIAGGAGGFWCKFFSWGDIFKANFTRRWGFWLLIIIMVRDQFILTSILIMLAKIVWQEKMSPTWGFFSTEMYPSVQILTKKNLNVNPSPCPGSPLRKILTDTLTKNHVVHIWQKLLYLYLKLMLLP